MLLNADDAPRHETPNAVMRTLAAPSLGALELSVWEVAMSQGQCGPDHAVDREQVWVVLEGKLRMDIDQEEFVAQAGDTVRLPPQAPRRIAAVTNVRALVASPAAPTVTTPDRGTRPLPWAA